MGPRDTLLTKSKDKSFHVLNIIIEQTDKRSNRWYAVKENKTRIMNKLNISLPTLDKHIKSLKDRKLIVPRQDRGVYSLNPTVFDLANEKL